MPSTALLTHARHARPPVLALAIAIAIACLNPFAGGTGLAHAAPAATPKATAATEASLQAIFAAEKMPERMRQAMQSVNQAQLDDIEGIADPAEKERKRKSYAAAQPVLQQHFEWTRLAPMVTEVYRAQYTEADAQALLAFYGSAPGRLHLEKVQPAMIEAALALAKFMDERVDAIFESSDDQGRAKEARKPKPAAWVAADAHDAAAGNLARLLMQDEFNARMKRLESAMASQVALVQPQDTDKKQKQWFANISQRIRTEVRFDTVLPLIVQRLRAHLTQDELRVLLDSERSPARTAQRARATATNSALQTRLQEKVATEIFPAMMAAVLRAEGSGTPPAGSEPKR